MDSLDVAPSASAAVLRAAAVTPIVLSQQHDRHLKHRDSSYYYYPHEGNSTLSASVTIHVTPEHYYLISWAILWGCFVLAIAFGAYQTSQEHQWLTAARKTTTAAAAASDDLEHQPKGVRRANGGGRNTVLVGGTRVSMNVGAGAPGANGTGPGADGEAVSSGDMSRTMFRRLLLVAMVIRAIAIPVQIYADPLSVQLIADTLPVMAFASAWTMLVSFFVQLVGVALGTGTSTTPGTVIQITAYCVYVVLIATILFHQNAAAVLLYSLLCCIYAALLGTSLYFCPRLLTLLYPSLMVWKRQLHQLSTEPANQSPPPPASGRTSASATSSPTAHTPSAPPALAIRLAISSGLCLFVFAARTINFANKIVAPAHTASWWWQYGALELIPSVLFLIIVRHPKAASASTSATSGNKTTDDAGSNGGGGRMSRTGRSFQRTDSYGSGSRPTKSASETSPLVRSSGGYGSSGGGGGGMGASDSASSLKDHGIGGTRKR